MPHIIVEYSSGIDTALNISSLIDRLHIAAVEHPHLPAGGIRVRAHRAVLYKVGDGEAGSEFIYIVVRLGQGRADDVKRDIGNTFFNVLTGYTEIYFDAGHALSLGLEIQEIEKDWTWKKNNIHQIIKDKRNG